MGLESFPKSNGSEKQPDENREAESVGDDKEKSVGRHAEEYKEADGVSHRTHSLREGLDQETIKKLEKLKKKQDDDEDNSNEAKKAA